KIESVMGVAKAYTTRVGEGPFPTQFSPEFENGMRLRGKEYGATTGRPRRCGWFDAVVVRHAIRVNGLSSLAITKLDVLDNLEKIKICVGYKYQGGVLEDFPALLKVAQQCEPVYEEMEGWTDDISHIKDYQRLPEKAKRYLERLTELLNTEISLVSVGPKREQTIILKGLL
ncbi:adenylosuccinate synthetase, partial [bacterium]|nr:adenylosuccinate synthetase [bacterium]